MSPNPLLRVMGLGGSLLVLASAAAEAQTANGSPTAPAPPGVAGTARPTSRSTSRTAPSARARAVKPDSTLPEAKMRALPKPTAAEIAEKRKLDHDLKICIGC